MQKNETRKPCYRRETARCCNDVDAIVCLSVRRDVAVSVADNVSLYLFTFLAWKDTCFVKQSPKWSFKVVQGRRMSVGLPIESAHATSC